MVISAAFGLNGEGHACIPRKAVDEDRAGPAFSPLAADLGSREADALPKDVEEGPAGLNRKPTVCR